MVIEKRALFNIGKNYCKLITWLDEHSIQYFENEKYDEIVIDLEEYSHMNSLKESVIDSLFIGNFISINEKESIQNKNINTLLFWR